ncbi:hypothetical protein [Dyella sp.]|jgi:hypothetical protein|uniref:hypothetical protein n=1 Tax=Dyella sp. TaxID=1869338 RepID=UPI002D77D517|nr:hypothetical protein [Dyella sp.]HET6432632.1 hypothetical protein [Dyella sp.]
MRPRRLLIPLLVLLAGCQHGPPAGPDTEHAPAAPATTPPADAPDFVDDALGLSLTAPAGMQLRHDFQRSYLGNGEWKTYAGPHSNGSPRVALVKDGSGHLLAAELRIGTSDEPTAVARCRKLPDSAEPGSVTQVTLDGVPFVRFRAADAAMSHFMQVQSYRTVRAGQCVAIDLLVYGTRPEVYDPPRSAPFTQAQAWSALHAALASLHWAHRAGARTGAQR